MFFIKKLKRENNVLGWWPKTINKRKEIESTGTRA
jgi:hypothetical protein